MPQFSLKRLFVSITLISVGCGMVVWAIQHDSTLSKCIGVVSPPVFGAGIGNLFKRTASGTLWGLLLLLGLMAIFGLLVTTHVHT